MDYRELGMRRFGKMVDVTDPSYDKDVWCRLNGVEIVPGMYKGIAKVFSDEETDNWGERVGALVMVNTDARHSDLGDDMFEEIGEIGVDSGLAGFFENKPDFTDAGWARFTRIFHKPGKAWKIGRGFVASSGFGDGEYRVLGAKRPGGRYHALCIVFITDQELKEEEEEDAQSRSEYDDPSYLGADNV